MEKSDRYVTGLDVGTENVRAVVATVGENGGLAVVGFNEGKSMGMRKGVPANLTGPAEAIDRMLGEVERMSGREVHSAYVSVNGAQILTTRTEGMIAVFRILTTYPMPGKCMISADTVNGAAMTMPGAGQVTMTMPEEP